MLGNRRYCYPLTITDFASRYLLTCKVLSTTQETFAFTCVKPTARISRPCTAVGAARARRQADMAFRTCRVIRCDSRTTSRSRAAPGWMAWRAG